jgi:hypothetical protein
MCGKSNGVARYPANFSGTKRRSAHGARVGGNSMVAGVQWSKGIEDAWGRVVSFLPKLLGFIVILIIGYFVAKRSRRSSTRSWSEWGSTDWSSAVA